MLFSHLLSDYLSSFVVHIAKDEYRPEETELFFSMSPRKDGDGMLTPPLAACGFGCHFLKCCRYRPTTDSFRVIFKITVHETIYWYFHIKAWLFLVVGDLELKVPSSLLQILPVHLLSTSLMQHWMPHLKVKDPQMSKEDDKKNYIATQVHLKCVFLVAFWHAEEEENGKICSDATPLPITQQEDEGN